MLEDDMLHEVIHLHTHASRVVVVAQPNFVMRKAAARCIICPTGKTAGFPGCQVLQISGGKEAGNARG